MIPPSCLKLYEDSSLVSLKRQMLSQSNSLYTKSLWVKALVGLVTNALVTILGSELVLNTKELLNFPDGDFSILKIHKIVLGYIIFLIH